MADSLNLGRDWDKAFPLSPAVEHSKAVFRNRFGIELAADVYVPKGDVYKRQGEKRSSGISSSPSSPSSSSQLRETVRRLARPRRKSMHMLLVSL